MMADPAEKLVKDMAAKGAAFADIINAVEGEQGAFRKTNANYRLPGNVDLTLTKNPAVMKIPSFDEVRARVFKFSGVDERAEFARQAISDARSKGIELSADGLDEIKDLAEVPGIKEAMDGWIKWADQKPFPTKIENPNGSAWHKVFSAYQGKRILWGNMQKGVRYELHIPPDYDEFFAEQPQIMLVEHDWAKAFAGATDFDEGEFPLPYERCVFEFRLSGRRALVLLHHHQHIVITEIGAGHWMATEESDLADLKNGNRYGCLYDNIRAICIALDAEVAVTSVTRAPHRLNIAREKQGKPPINDYHVINLARRSRVEALPASEHEARWHPRLHFRRGHWRHFTDHKTWIKWMLVGNPDLGFIDKEYRA